MLSIACEMETKLSSMLPTSMVSSTILNGPDQDQMLSLQHFEPICGSTIVLHETSKKGNKKSEETVYIPTNMARVSISKPEQQQQLQQLAEHYHRPEQDQQQQQPTAAAAPATIFTTTSGGKSCSSRIQINRTECTSAVTETVSSSEKDFHVVKIQISPNFGKFSSSSNICVNSSTSTVAISANSNNSNNNNNRKSNNSVVDINRVNVTTSAEVSEPPTSSGGERASSSVQEVHKSENTKLSASASQTARSSTVLIGSVAVGDLLVSSETASPPSSSSLSKSDHTSDLSVVHKSTVKSPKVSIVSFISDDPQNKCSTQPDREDPCKVSVRSVCHSQTKNISQTFLTNSESASVDLNSENGDERLALSKPDSIIVAIGKSTTYLRPDSPQFDEDSLLLEADSSTTVRLARVASSSDRSIVNENSTSAQDQPDAVADSSSLVTLAISAEQSAASALSCCAKDEEKAVVRVSDVKTAAATTPETVQVLNTRVIVDTTSEEIQTISATTTTITSNEMVQKPSGDLEVSNPTYLYYMMTSGQCSPSDTLDSGTCSDMENGGSNSTSTSESSITPPPLPKKMGPKLKMLHLKSGTIINEDGGHSSDEQGDPVNEMTKPNGNHTRTGSFTDSEESECSLSCDSLNSSEFARSMSIPSPPNPPIISHQDTIAAAISMLPDSLLRDIRDRKFIPREDSISEDLSDDFADSMKIEEDQPVEGNRTTCVMITHANSVEDKSYSFETDKFYKFHINEMDMTADLADTKPKFFQDDETFAGYKDIHSGTSTIRSSKGTVRGVKNRVRNGIATFLQMQQTNVKNYKEKDLGKVVLYTTSMGIIRETYAKCANVKQILRTLLIKFEERDVFMSCDYQQEIKERMQSDDIQVPQLFVEGQHIGDAATVERLNESGELRQMLKPYKSMTSSYTCQFCGGYRLLPCPSCNGSKKSVHRNHFTTEFVALKCMNCDEVGLVKCHNC